MLSLPTNTANAYDSHELTNYNKLSKPSLTARSTWNQIRHFLYKSLLSSDKSNAEWLKKELSNFDELLRREYPKDRVPIIMAEHIRAVLTAHPEALHMSLLKVLFTHIPKIKPATVFIIASDQVQRSPHATTTVTVTTAVSEQPSSSSMLGKQPMTLAHNLSTLSHQSTSSVSSLLSSPDLQFKRAGADKQQQQQQMIGLKLTSNDSIRGTGVTATSGDASPSGSSVISQFAYHHHNGLDQAEANADVETHDVDDDDDDEDDDDDDEEEGMICTTDDRSSEEQPHEHCRNSSDSNQLPEKDMHIVPSVFGGGKNSVFLLLKHSKSSTEQNHTKKTKKTQKQKKRRNKDDYVVNATYFNNRISDIRNKQQLQYTHDVLSDVEEAGCGAHQSVTMALTMQASPYACTCCYVLIYVLCVVHSATSVWLLFNIYRFRFSLQVSYLSVIARILWFYSIAVFLTLEVWKMIDVVLYLIHKMNDTQKWRLQHCILLPVLWLQNKETFYTFYALAPNTMEIWFDFCALHIWMLCLCVVHSIHDLNHRTAVNVQFLSLIAYLSTFCFVCLATLIFKLRYHCSTNRRVSR